VKRDLLARGAVGLLVITFIVALFADFLASDLPVACRFHGALYLAPSVTHPAPLAGYDAAGLARAAQPGDWSIRSVVHFGPFEGTAEDGAPAAAPPFSIAGHPLGTDAHGRDVFARLVHGARTSLGVGLVAVLGFVAIGVALGGLAGFYGGILDAFIGRIVETLTPFPTLILVLVVQALVPHPSIVSMLVAIGLTRWTEVARIVRAEVLLVTSQDYVMAARALGARPIRILLRHIAPNAAAPVLVTAAFGVAQVVLIESSLQFLRVGFSTAASWGEMLSEARGQPQAYWLLVFPGLAIFTLVLALHAVGEALRDALDPRLGRPADGLPPRTDMPPPGDTRASAKAGTLLSK
jgi:peptide/nickel transport system permease protein